MSNLQNGRKKISRRDFVNHAGTLMGLGMVGLNSLPSDSNTKQSLNIRIKNVDSDFEREPLFPYRFKGSAITECWQTAA